MYKQYIPIRTWTQWKENNKFSSPFGLTSITFRNKTYLVSAAEVVVIIVVVIIVVVILKQICISIPL